MAAAAAAEQEEKEEEPVKQGDVTQEWTPASRMWDNTSLIFRLRTGGQSGWELRFGGTWGGSGATGGGDVSVSDKDIKVLELIESQFQSLTVFQTLACEAIYSTPMCNTCYATLGTSTQPLFEVGEPLRRKKI